LKIVRESVTVDGIDKIIIKNLLQDARTPIQVISSVAGISGAAVHQRLKKLEKANVISGSQIILNPKILGFKTVAFIGIYLDKAIRNPEAVKQLKNIPEVIECHYTTGNWSIFAKLLCRDNEHLMELLNKNIQSVEGVSRTETFISLEEQINRQVSF
jgi:Lrp/AsnC family transcriptional regulator for asnA, asnC and gidA